MTTPAFPDSILTKIRAGKQATRFRAVLKQVYQFRAYCCNLNGDSMAVMGVTKTPICDLVLTPNPVCVNENVNYDMTGSYSPTDSIPAGGYSIDWGDNTGTQYGSTGSHQYTAAGTYNVVARVDEVSTRFQTANAQVVVVDCSVPMLMTYTYAATYGDGVWFMDWTATVPTWEARNTGLEGNALFVNSLVINPSCKHLPDVSHELWAATLGGLYRTWNGGRAWEKLVLPDPDNTDFGDVPPATVDQLNWICVRFSQTDPDIVYAMAALAAPARTWMYSTSTAGITWSSRGIM